MRIRFSMSTRVDDKPVNSVAAVRQGERRARLWGLSALAAFALLVIHAGPALAQGTPASGAETPANLAPPAGAVLVFELNARGDQIYTCEPKPDDASAYVWTFKAPEAELFNSRGEIVGRHFAGPTWQGNDGSAVVGSVLERADAPESGAIPWLLLEATDHAGSGIFSTITHIQRLATVGGTAPAEGCDAVHAGEESRQPYEATYAFYYAATPATPTA
jgi:hypothetical protein